MSSENLVQDEKERGDIIFDYPTEYKKRGQKISPLRKAILSVFELGKITVQCLFILLLTANLASIWTTRWNSPTLLNIDRGGSSNDIAMTFGYNPDYMS